MTYLTVSGVLEAPAIFRERFGLTIPGMDTLLVTLLILFFLFGALVYIPIVSLVSPYPGFCDFYPDVHRSVREKAIHRAIVFVRPGGEMALPGIIANDPDIGRSDVIFASDLGPEENKKVIARYPGRSVHYFKQRSYETYLKRKLRKLYIRRLSESSNLSVNSPNWARKGN